MCCTRSHTLNRAIWKIIFYCAAGIVSFDKKKLYFFFATICATDQPTKLRWDTLLSVDVIMMTTSKNQRFFFFINSSLPSLSSLPWLRLHSFETHHTEYLQLFLFSFLCTFWVYFFVVVGLAWHIHMFFFVAVAAKKFLSHSLFSISLLFAINFDFIFFYIFYILCIHDVSLSV